LSRAEAANNTAAARINLTIVFSLSLLGSASWMDIQQEHSPQKDGTMPEQK
jgi:hypothetical protein